MKGLRKLLPVMLAAAMLLALMPTVALAALEDTLTGTFAVNAPPSVTSVTLTETAMTPQTEYSVTVVVGDADNLSDINTVVLKVWYDSDGGTPTVGEYDLKTTPDTQTYAVITYTVSTDTFAIDPSASTTWVLGASVAFTAGEKTSTSGDCIFVFTPGKVATETAVGLWQIAAKVTDSGSQTAFGYDTTPGATMAWYGEVAVGPASVDFGNLVAGTDFGASTIQSVASVTYIANGAYDEKVKSNSTWGGTSALDPTGATSVAEEFALRADDTATLGTAVLVNTTGVVIDTPNGQTGETGDVVTTNNLWLKLASTFTAGTYSSGIITYIIS